MRPKFKTRIKPASASETLIVIGMIVAVVLVAGVLLLGEKLTGGSQ